MSSQSSGEKTEQATPKKLSDLRKRGQVARSPELTAALGLLCGLWLIQASGSHMYSQLSQLMAVILANSGSVQLTPNVLGSGMARLVMEFGALIGVLLAGFVLIALVIGIAQTGFLITLKPLAPSFDRINPGAGLKRLFSKSKLVDTLKLTIKVGVVALILSLAIADGSATLANLLAMPLFQGWQSISNVVGGALWKIALIFAGLAATDYLLARRKFHSDAKMTRQEIRDEFKQAEGNPQIKAKIRSRMRARLRAQVRRRLVDTVPTATVVITNPTHFAVALRYNAAESPAPRVVAKGQDYMALRIKEIARQHGVPMVENRPLAQALYKSVQVDSEIPPDLYQAVAQVLAFVFRLKNLKRASLPPRTPLARPVPARPMPPMP